MSLDPKQIVLLAAGMGTRLGTLNRGLPKALFEVAGRSLVNRALDFARCFDAEDKFVVAGFEADKVGEHLRERTGEFTLLKNPDYRIGNLRTLETALPQLRGDTLVMNVDHIYPPAIAERMLGMAGEHITAMVDFDRALTDDDMKVELGDRKMVANISKTLQKYDCGYVGMTYLAGDRLADYRLAVSETKAEVGPKANVEQVLQRLADFGHSVVIGDISGIGWHEVDTPEDYDKAMASGSLK